MGQPQFMPSSFLKYAVDFDDDGHPDIWGSSPDVFASMANYLKGAGWTENTRWGREVTISRAAMTLIDRSVPMRRDGGCRAEREMTEARPLSDWHALGVALPGGGALPKVDLAASLVRGARRNFLVYATTARSSTTTARTPTPSRPACWPTHFNRSQNSEVRSQK
jgi:membrane-bound lytic murein transglycosylase B